MAVSVNRVGTKVGRTEVTGVDGGRQDNRHAGLGAWCCVGMWLRPVGHWRVGVYLGLSLMNYQCGWVGCKDKEETSFSSLLLLAHSPGVRSGYAILSLGDFLGDHLTLPQGHVWIVQGC